ncbi:HET-domain-containing protein [Dendrothele bispora CBS 962.96]|uniref:HET-domain-containing protein n=1 Tax=Dendrothele bispora (strain CBS 962.96) TaxID=1314807 RepID=A0A4S8M0M4_DENBC|nr:HET-domain-containing protein [Dendrothele bispora CBS 962.96]
MRLLNTETFKVEEFITDIPTYAILSHTWEKDEVTLQDIQDLNVARQKAGWSKVWNACQYVRRYKFQWIWIDTCCIDKSSSAELSEALNSMYKYYEDGRVCIAYLSDTLMEEKAMDLEKLKESRWFTRGWTLQELIAPHFMVFLDQDWKMIGTRFSMQDTISEVTSIPVKVFEQKELDGYSIAQKMSWAASRRTTREEDMAYCLMGLFGVSMPPIYGEGAAKAFMRLQQEIIKYSDDRSIFAWVASQDLRDRGLFASSPSEFELSGEIGKSDSEDLGDKSSFSFGNNGLRIHLPLYHRPSMGKDIHVASLHCQAAGRFVGIYLQKQEHRYIRWRPRLPLPRIDRSSADLHEVVVKESTAVRPSQQIKNSYSFPIEFKFDPQIIALDEIYYAVYSGDIATHIGRDPSYLLIHYFTLRTKKGQEVDVEISAVIQDDNIPVIDVKPGHNGRSLSSNRTLLEDSFVLSVMNDNALLSCFTHVTGGCLSERVVEFNILPYNARFQLCRPQINESSPRASSSTALDFIVDINSNRDYIFSSPHSMFPYNLPWRHDDKIAYVSFSKRGGQCDPHCVFAYRLTAWKFVIIALGLRTESNCHIPWIDVDTVQSDSEEISISDIWKSYLPSGSRYKSRPDGLARISLEEFGPLTVTVENTSEPNFYHVVIKDEWYSQPNWRPWEGASSNSLSEGRGLWESTYRRLRSTWER